MRTLYYQCSAGIAGDMHLGAMLDLGVSESLLRRQLARLPCAEEFEISVARARKSGIAGVRVCVTDQLAGQPGRAHRHYRDIVQMIRAARFEAAVESRALAIFRRIAEAEAKIHELPVEEVHFHEVGAVDSIVDVVGAAICLEALSVEQVLSEPVQLGSGYIDCAHGRLPVPAPATQEILKGAPCAYAGVEGEATTPTGAAILRASVDHFAPPQQFVPTAIGYGLGERDFKVPNVLRLALGEAPQAAVQPPAEARHYRIDANIDDMSPEAYEPLIEHLLRQGASDVFVTPVVMKKSRPAMCLSVLCAAEQVDALSDAILNRSTTIGLRLAPFFKRVLPRETRLVQTSLGEVHVKQATRPDGKVRWKSEHDDIRRLADAAGLDYLEAKFQVDQELARILKHDAKQTD